MKSERSTCIRLALLATVAALVMLAQGDRGVITGTITDPGGAIVPGVQITATHSSTNVSYKVKTSSAGDYTFASLPVGAYAVRVEVQGFKAHVTNNVLISPGSEVRVDVQLEVGSTQTSIEVSASAQVIQTENARVATMVSNTLVNALPVQVNGNSRSPFDLAGTTAEVNAAGTFRIGGGNDTVGITLDGSSLAGNKLGSDAGNGGAAAMNSPSVEALTEFTVEASGFKAENGHASGGTLSFVSKSGTNQFHGSAFEFLRNQDFDAKGFFNSVIPIYKQNNFGVTAGGPVYLPKLYNGKNKTFFFASYEGFRNRVGAGNGSFFSVPPPAFYKGDLSQWVNGSGQLYQIYDPGSQTQLANGSYQRTPFANNQIPQSRFDPTIVPVLNYVSTILTPNRPGIVPGTFGYVNNNFYNNTGTSISPNNRWSAKIDQTLGSKHHISYFMNRYWDLSTFGPAGPVGLPAPLGSGTFGYNKTQVYRANWDWSITPTFLNRFYGGFNWFREDHTQGEATETGSLLAEGLNVLVPAGTWKSKGICLPGFILCSNFPIISTGDFSGWGNNAPNGSDRLVFELHDDMTKIHGAHTFKWGYFYGNSHYDGFGLQFGSGGVGFSSQSTDNIALGPGLSESVAGGSGFASMLLGQVNSFNMDSLRYLLVAYVTHQAYVQDDWKVSHKLTLNLGFRYEMNVAPHALDGKLSNLNFTTPNPVAGGIPGATEFAGSGAGRTGSNALIANWYGGLGPRLSLAYAVNSKTVIRAAATRSFGPLAGIGQSSHQLGFAIRNTVNNQSGGVAPLYVLSKGPGVDLTLPNINPGVGVGGNAPSYGKNGNDANRSDGELNYSFNVQRQITRTSSFEIGWMATLASHITSNYLVDNQVPYRSLPASMNPFTTAGRTVLSSQITSSSAINAGAVLPWTCGANSSSQCIPFTQVWGTGSTVTQANRPYPQYGTIDTGNGGGDRIGHSTYHALIAKFDKRVGNGLTIQSSFTFSKLLDDSDTAYLAAFFYGDMYNLRALKSIASYDQTKALKIVWVYELPFGKGKYLLGNGGVVSAIVGGWRISGTQTYASGLPMNIGTNAPSFPIGEFSNTPTISTYQGWTLPYSGKFDPFKDSYLQPQSFFPAQSSTSFGNSTRYNPSFRSWPQFNESAGVTRVFSIKERAHVELRGEAFNILNRTWFGPLGGATSLGNANWGKWQAQVNSARQMQLVAKLTW
uniref:TonB-dependent transporter Oar-like beta-barrel domain-containing protein n=1 Tax=Solibacter usitatus (strain Ellin6076) TaxID=234267 RepID=Q01RN1_SOLUE